MQGGEKTKILLIRLSSIGDIVLTTPVIRLLRQKYPEAQIDYLVKSRFAELLQNNPHLTRVLEFPEPGNLGVLRAIWHDIHQQKYNAIIDLHKNVRSLILSVCQKQEIKARFRKHGWRRTLLVKFGLDVYAKESSVMLRYIETTASLGITDDGEGTELFPPAELLEKIEKRTGLSLPKSQVVVALAPGAAHFTKRWPVENYKTIAKALVQQGKKCIILGGSGDQQLSKEVAATATEIVNFTGQLSLLESAAVLEKCDRLVTNDTGLMHMAEAVKTPVTAIFGSTVRQLGFYPFLQESRVIENETVKCRPCSHVGRQNCPKGHFLCMNSIPPEAVLEKIE